MDKVTIQVPATSANIGSGFDCAGVALKLYNVFSFERLSKGIEFEGCDKKFANEKNLAYVAYKAVCDKIGVDSFVKITELEINVPVSRGLGSSATLICAGAVAANLLNGKKLSMSDIFEICNEIEGHPDNVAPALFGGLCLSLVDGKHPITVKYHVSEKVCFTPIVPNFEVCTKDARATLPEKVSREDAVYNLSRASLLSHAFENGDFELIKLVTKDRLHEQYKKRLFKNIAEVENIAYSVGAVSFIISGAGSTCMCISDRPIYRELNEKISTLDNGWVAYTLSVDNNGTQEVQNGK